MSKRLVVDASIARAAGQTDHPTSTHCRQWLEMIRDKRHLTVFTREILDEWKKHESRFAMTWRLSHNARKLQVFVRDAENPALRDQIDTHAPNDKARAEMLKDVHLLEAALATDNIISSLNETDRDRFQAVAPKIALIQPIIWVNPNNEAENCMDWLRNGAAAEPQRQLGYRLPPTDTP